jgi:hypothetical protein
MLRKARADAGTDGEIRVERLVEIMDQQQGPGARETNCASGRDRFKLIEKGDFAHSQDEIAPRRDNAMPGAPSLRLVQRDSDA